LVRRAYDLGALTEASYRRANIRLRQFGQEEPAELPPEVPTLLNRSIELLGDDYPLESLALDQGLSAADVQALVRGDVPGSASDPTALSSNEQLWLLPKT
jgi:hypothetical protein